MKQKMALIVLVILLGLTVGCKKKSGEDQSRMTTPESPAIQESGGANFPVSPPEDIGSWQAYQNGEHGYSVKYPSSWFFLEDACCPPPPGYVVLNNYSTKQVEYASHQMEEGVQGVHFSCLYEGKIDDIGEVQHLKKEGESSRELKINGFDAIRFERDMVPGDSSVKSVSYYVVDGEKGCRLGLNTPCDTCEQIVSTFVFE